MGTGCQTLACSLRTFVNECGLALFGPVFAALAPFGTVPIECALVWYIGCCLFWALAALNSAARNSVRHIVATSPRPTPAYQNASPSPHSIPPASTLSPA